MKFEFIKVHGSGNDFLLVDELAGKGRLTDRQRAVLARVFCDRDKGPGADGILFIQKSESADAVMRVFNADGSEASMCGNGLRCAGRYVCELLGKEEAVVETMKANLAVRKAPEIAPGVSTYNVEISPVSFKLEDLPLKLNKEKLIKEKLPELDEGLEFTALAVPNPHLIAIVEKEQLGGSLQRSISEKVNGPNELFPDGVNVSFVLPIKEGHIYVRTFERGVGFTNACGTAMSASSLVTCLYGLNTPDHPISVYNDGGMVQCVVRKRDGGHFIELIGNATFLYKAEAEIDFTSMDQLVKEVESYQEQKRYQALQEKVIKFLNSES
ncbi:diaminopimelate epimerase [Bacillus sp. B-jedd]|uniref:diaminopimelate epimerase n=1 Tax=Bacillus sp. B-jedd TaxID=1476857 RepID=UPI0005155D4A|nr:diaminopimelate epimerase [Bacillus sp. B-jedd]CEG27515.1 diaminopimelate epimerase [Bacillus sp. B-jedd]